MFVQQICLKLYEFFDVFFSPLLQLLISVPKTSAGGRGFDHQKEVLLDYINQLVVSTDLLEKYISSSKFGYMKLETPSKIIGPNENSQQKVEAKAAYPGNKHIPSRLASLSR